MENSVLAEGIREGLIVWNKNGELILVDGHHRYELVQKHSLEFRISKRQFDNLEEALQFLVIKRIGGHNYES